MRATSLKRLNTRTRTRCFTRSASGWGRIQPTNPSYTLYMKGPEDRPEGGHGTGLRFVRRSVRRAIPPPPQHAQSLCRVYSRSGQRSISNSVHHVLRQIMGNQSLGWQGETLKTMNSSLFVAGSAAGLTRSWAAKPKFSTISSPRESCVCSIRQARLRARKRK